MYVIIIGNSDAQTDIDQKGKKIDLIDTSINTMPLT